MENKTDPIRLTKIKIPPPGEKKKEMRMSKNKTVKVINFEKKNRASFSDAGKSDRNFLWEFLVL